jgi:hypothetical protein
LIQLHEATERDEAWHKRLYSLRSHIISMLASREAYAPDFKDIPGNIFPPQCLTVESNLDNVDQADQQNIDANTSRRSVRDQFSTPSDMDTHPLQNLPYFSE